jgi:hypothetical protein
MQMSIFSGYESAGVSYVNGERVISGNNAYPYANANAPPAPVNQTSGSNVYHQSSSGSNSYPPYPSNTGSSNGYPAYPQSTNQADRHHNLGYPPYPTQNKMPTPGQSSYPGYPQSAGYPQTYANYPQQYPGYQSNNPYPNYPQQNYPHQNYPNQNQRGYNTYSSNSIFRKNIASVGMIASMILVGFSELFVLMITRL